MTKGNESNILGNSEASYLKDYSKNFTKSPLFSQDLIQRLRSGEEVKDTKFDEIFPEYYRVVSEVHWSSIKVGRQIALWLSEKPRLKFLDVGCGVGKLCFLLRLLTEHEIHGIEQRRNLVKIANTIIQKNSFAEISIKQMNMMALEWDEYDVYYFYNPFQEHLLGSGIGVVEQNIELDKKNYSLYISEVFRQLSWAESGKMLITYHGFGGRIPSSWRLVSSAFIGGGHLELWMNER